MEKLSAAIITFNEACNIRRCIESLLSVADEIVVLDSNSTDATRAICSEYPIVRFHSQAFAGHIQQKNDVASLTTYDLVLSLDADEALSEELKLSISEIKQNRKCDGYTMNRLTSYCGKWIRHCGWYPDRKIRLFDRRKGAWGGINPHDKYELFPGGTSSHIEGDILHFSYNSFEELQRQTDKFARLGAQDLFEKGRGSAWVKLFFSPAVRFIRAYFLKLGFLDGVAGFTISWYSAIECFKKYNYLRKRVFESYS
ncbi:MAG: glycosyltransferase family 2 protein [Bacteroidota bacterium]